VHACQAAGILDGNAIIECHGATGPQRVGAHLFGRVAKLGQSRWLGWHLSQLRHCCCLEYEAR